MTNFFLRIYCILLLAFTAHLYFSQDYKNGVSDGNLIINSQKIPIKIFTSTDLSDFARFADQNIQPSLVILNDTNFETGDADRNLYNQTILENYKTHHFQVLDQDFKPTKEEVTVQNISNYKYLLAYQKTITENDHLSLDTEFMIWDPSIGIKLGPITLHYYSLMFIIAFGLGYFLMSTIFKIDRIHEKYLDPLFTWTLVGTILGARLGHVLFYEKERFKNDIWSVFLPIKTNPHFEFTGFQGLASHGATIMLILTTLYYSYKIIKKNPLWVYDRLGIVVAIGGAFVRIGNFFNSEIIGKPVAPDSPFAVLFPQMSKEYGLTVPRYPTQLFEAFGYIVLFVILWVLYRYTNKKYQQGWLFGLFFIILWTIRFLVEYLKEPQGDEFITIGNLNTGQVLSIPFIIAGFAIMFISSQFKITEEENAKPE